jgi:N6-adenosine-specific RNA methylase IME4
MVIDPFACVEMDPPWPERGGGKSKRGADRHYVTLRLPQICTAITDCQHWRNVARDAHLWMWVTDNYLRHGLSLMDALGFDYKRTFPWVKVDDDPPDGWIDAIVAAKPGDNFLDILADLLQMGLGQYGRGAHELLLFGTRGKAMLPPPKDRPKSVVFAKDDEWDPSMADVDPLILSKRCPQHSRKPDRAYYSIIERVSPGPRLSMFSRRLREGWTVWGNEVPT